MPNIEKVKNQEGKTIFPVTVADAVLMGDGQTLKGKLSELGSKVNLSDRQDKIYPNDVSVVKEHEFFVSATIDKEGKLLETIDKNGDKQFYRNVDVKELLNIGKELYVGGKPYEHIINIGENIPFTNIKKVINDFENRIELKLDSNGRIISYRDSYGVLHENSGIDTPNVVTQKINGIDIERLIGGSGLSYREYDLPKYGRIVMEKELFFFNGENNVNPKSISKVNGKYYMTETLVGGQAVSSSVEVSIIEKDVELSSWPIDKTTKHYVKSTIDFGSYLKGTFYVEVKYQGTSTLSYDKKNFRFTFYENELFSNKKTLKIGELISTSKYNLKAYYLDLSLMREPSCMRIIQAIREINEFNKQYPWASNYDIPTGATGLAINFPISVSINNDFQGLYYFGLAKDIHNFMLDEESNNGILIQGDGGANEDSTFWKVLAKNEWSDLLNDIDFDISDNSLPYVQSFYDYINSNEFTKETAHQHLDVDNWIDAIIIFQLFSCRDSLAKNIILYAGSDKTKFSPFYYDLDWTWVNSDYTNDVFTNAQANDKSLWIKFKEMYWNEICQRYKELRENVITIESITHIVQSLYRSVDYSDYIKEKDKWNSTARKGTVAENIEWMKNRINWTDIYFNN